MSNDEFHKTLLFFQDRLQETGVGQETDKLLLVNVSDQVMQLLEVGEKAASYRISTAANGMGCEEGSYCTPVGLHRISEKIGRDEPDNMIFRGRMPVGELAEIESSDCDTGKDQITSRILWLEGLEGGLNRGGNVDSHNRYIYIHGTNEEGRIGQPVSHGCIRMRNRDIVELFERVEEGDLVIIT